MNLLVYPVPYDETQALFDHFAAFAVSQKLFLVEQFGKNFFVGFTFIHIFGQSAKYECIMINDGYGNFRPQTEYSILHHPRPYGPNFSNWNRISFSTCIFWDLYKLKIFVTTVFINPNNRMLI